MSRRWYSRRHYDRLANGGPDTPEQVAERIKHRTAGDQAFREMMARFCPQTPEEMLEALEWHARRVKELMEQ